MTIYDQWNKAFLTYFIEGISRGSTIFLSVDDEVIHQVGSDLGEQKPLEAFQKALYWKVIFGNRVDLEKIKASNEQEPPKALAFLAACVLAASKMADEGEIHQRDYFKRLREVLGLPIEAGRPNGLDSGAEEPLWQEWNRWLQEHDFLPSAQRGEGSSKYINYPKSQALLRKADRDRLRKLFNEKGWPQDWDVETLAAQVQKEAPTLPRHLQKLLDARGERYDAVTEAIYDVYQRWQYDPDALGLSSALNRFNLFAGLLREEDPIQGEVIYYLFPKQARRRRVTQEIQVRIDDTLHPLVKEEEGSGWYMPLEQEVGQQGLNNGVRYPIEQPSLFQHLILPQREFWILTPDPDNPEFGDYATWGPPQLGTPFLLLCQHELLPQLRLLRDEQLIKWHGEPEEVFDGWVELQHCMVLTQTWAGVFIENEALHAALQPRRSLSISLSGGLRAPSGSGWLEGHGPEITIFGFCPEADVHIFRISGNQEQEVSHVTKSSKPTNQSFSFEWPRTGTYRVEASYAGEKAERLVKIVRWEELKTSSPREQLSTCLKGVHICGALVKGVRQVQSEVWQYMLPI